MFKLKVLVIAVAPFFAFGCSKAASNSSTKDVSSAGPSTSAPSSLLPAAPGTELADGTVLAAIGAAPSVNVHDYGVMAVAAADVQSGIFLIDGTQAPDSTVDPVLEHMNYNVGFCMVLDKNFIQGLPYTIPSGTKDGIDALVMSSDSPSGSDFVISLLGISDNHFSGFVCQLKGGPAATAQMTYGQFKTITGNRFIFRTVTSVEETKINSTLD